MDREDGEMSDDESMLMEENSDTSKSKFTVLFKADKKGLVVQELEKVDASKLEERAKRFGLDLGDRKLITQQQIDELYTNFGIESGNERHFRFDTLHLTGVDGLTTKEIFEYLEDYKPVSLEWIDGTSCNVICQDHISAALALLLHSREIKNHDLKKMISQSSTHSWREGMPHEKLDLILMRFATNSDKKDIAKVKREKPNQIPIVHDQTMDSVSKNPWGDLCQSWGVYDHQEILTRKLPADEDSFDESDKPIKIRNKNLAKRLGKRPKSESENSDSDSEWKKRVKAPRMRMHADDEETKRKKKQQSLSPQKYETTDTFAPLSIEVMNEREESHRPKQVTILSEKFKRHSRPARDTIHSRLGSKVVPDNKNDSMSDLSDSSNKSDHNVMSRVEIVREPGRNKEKSNVWSRLQLNAGQGNKTDLRQMIKSRKPQNQDLRQRLGKTKDGMSLRIEIDNDYHDME